MLRKIISICLFLPVAGVFTGPDNPSFELSGRNSSFMISGTSTLHDWHMTLKDFNCDPGFIITGTGLKGIAGTIFKCRVKDLKSESSLMDSKAYSALKSKDFPEISFTTASDIEFPSGVNQFKDNLKGELTVAGKRVPVTVPVEGSFQHSGGEDMVEIRGTTYLKMSDFNVTPPSFMMGALKTGDRITVTFSMQFFRPAGR